MAKGMDSLKIGYAGFAVLCNYIAKSYNSIMGEIYEKPFLGEKITEEDISTYNSLCNEDLDL